MDQATRLGGVGSNGTAKRAAKPRARRAAPAVAEAKAARLDSRFGRALTVGLGCGIPGLSLALSSIGGRLLAEGHPYLGGAALVLCSAVLAVSLSHLAWAIQDITRSARWQAWALALAVDVALVLGELACVAGAGWWLVTALMVAVACVSAVLNCWAFLRG
jgi:hypothetical protein